MFPTFRDVVHRHPIATVGVGSLIFLSCFALWISGNPHFFNDHTSNGGQNLLDDNPTDAEKIFTLSQLKENEVTVSTDEKVLILESLDTGVGTEAEVVSEEEKLKRLENLKGIK